jgi:DNA-binding CsgD family transcriptional regulator
MDIPDFRDEQSMKIQESLVKIETCDSFEALKSAMQGIIESYGFSHFSFIDVGDASIDEPFHLATVSREWDEDYRGFNMVQFDPVLSAARRRNTPFTWDEVARNESFQKKITKRSHDVDVLAAARDHGLKNGFVVPFHFVDSLGRQNSACCTFFWKDRISRLRFMLKRERHDLHMLMLYWAQKVMDLNDVFTKKHKRFFGENGESISRSSLTARERDVLSWTARGKTMADIAEILVISSHTVEAHMRQIMRKLGATNKTHAVAIGIFHNIIDL